MFIGHFALGFALKRVAPKTNLGWLIASVEFLDLVWPILILLGVERVEVDPGNTVFTPLNFVSYPYSHSLVAAVVWSILFGGVYYAVSRYRTGALVVAAGVLSHWFLDLIVHRPDLQLYPGGSGKFGLGMWNSLAATMIVEAIMFVAGVWLYVSMTKPRDAIGRWGLSLFVLFLVIVYQANAFAPPPPSSTAVGAAALCIWLLPFWAGWADAHRTSEPG
ncbi:MAG TPA: hypothetical protein VGJ02_00835 [Pyrinomonadaceae bacterium]|jgi:hypothetical protein